MKKFLFQKRNVIQNYYYNFWLKNGRNAEFLNFIKDKKHHFLKCYKLINEIHRKLHPFQFINEGDSVVHIGFHDGYINPGISHPLIMAGIIGEKGHLWTIEPDKTNNIALKKYIKANNIKNITIIEKGVWNKKTKLEFCLFKDFTSSNTPLEVINRDKKGLIKRWGKKRFKDQSYKKVIEVDTLDSIIDKKIKEKIDFINITVNGAAEEIFMGASKTLQKNSNIKFAFPYSHLTKNLENLLRKQKYCLTLGDSPHRPWQKEQFLYLCALKDKKLLNDKGFYNAFIQEKVARSLNGVGKYLIKSKRK